MKIKEVKEIDEERIIKEFKKVNKKIKNFENDYNVFKKSALSTKDIDTFLKKANTYAKIENTRCNNKIYWKA